MSQTKTDMTQAEPERLEIPLPWGAVFSDWSVVTSDNARASLHDTLGVLRMTKQWVGITDAEDVLRRSILNHYAKIGRAPARSELASIDQSSVSEIDGLLAQLEERDLIVLNPTDGAIQGAYPFTDRKTEHRIRSCDIVTNAMCAIDALGAGAMLDRDTVIESKCRHCECGISIKTKDRSRSIRSVTPASVVVWSGIHEIDGCAADTQCQVMAFFCSDDYLETWKNGQEKPPLGHRLSLSEGLQAGMAIFRPFLTDAPTRTHKTDRNQ